MKNLEVQSSENLFGTSISQFRKTEGMGEVCQQVMRIQRSGQTMEKLTGSMEALSAMQVTAATEGLDAESKTLLHSKEVLAVILQGTIEEYQGYTLKEIMDFIEADTITDTKEVSPGRTNTQLQGGNVEYVQLGEKTSNFDVVFKAKNPLLSDKDVLVSLHVDIEPQKTYRPGYPIEKRGMYYLARGLSSQLSLVTETTDYGKLEKCYSIWICRDDIPRKERYSISFYEMVNTRNTGNCMPVKENYDLMKLVVIRLGGKVYNGEKGEEGYPLLRFLNAVMYPHREDFLKTVSKYIDFSENEELWQEAENMSGLGQSVLKEGIEQGIEQGIEHRDEDLIMKKYSKGIPAESIAEFLEIPVEKVNGIILKKTIKF